MTVHEIASMLQGEVVGNGHVEILRVAKIEEAEAGDLTFLANPQYEKYLRQTNASAVLVSLDLDLQAYRDHVATSFIRVRDPYLGFLLALKKLTPTVDPFPVGIHPSAIVATSARLGADVGIGPLVSIGDGVEIGDNTKIAAGCVIARDARIGRDGLLYPNVTVYHQCRIGDRVIVHSGTVIGSDGFGQAPRPDGTYEKIPQLGIVVVEDDVEIGANCTIDRATLGETLIKRGVKLDNLIHIAHNVVVGENTVMAAQVGVSGSTKIGKNSIIAGQVGIVGHIEIAERSVILGQSGVSKSITEPGKTYFGYPAKEQRKAQRIEVSLRRLPEMMQELEELKKRVEMLTSELQKKA
jgi:UDP-3-O-[3-hydroxymyristoyl] glucosamine N-acyltransferase